MIGGQAVDVELSGKPVPREKLDFIYRLKTGALLEASMMIGAVLGGAEESELKLVEKTASCVGLAFQIQDDILDVEGDAETLGKPIGSDVQNDKATYVTLLGLAQSKETVRSLTQQAKQALAPFGEKAGFLCMLADSMAFRQK